MYSEWEGFLRSIPTPHGDPVRSSLVHHPDANDLLSVVLGLTRLGPSHVNLQLSHEAHGDVGVLVHQHIDRIDVAQIDALLPRHITTPLRRRAVLRWISRMPSVH